MKILTKLSNKFGFTETEIRVILFFLILTTLGGIWKIADVRFPGGHSYSYQKEDSLYKAVITSANEREGYRLNVEDIRSAALHDSTATPDTTTTEAPVEKLAKGSIGIVNINKATVAELTTLTGVGIKTAESIVAYRNSIKRFSSPEQLMDIKGIGKAKFEKLRKQISLH